VVIEIGKSSLAVSEKLDVISISEARNCFGGWSTD
jgi:hypothetical protein